MFNLLSHKCSIEDCETLFQGMKYLVSVHCVNSYLCRNLLLSHDLLGFGVMHRQKEVMARLQMAASPKISAGLCTAGLIVNLCHISPTFKILSPQKYQRDVQPLCITLQSMLKTSQSQITHTADHHRLSHDFMDRIAQICLTPEMLLAQTQVFFFCLFSHKA